MSADMDTSAQPPLDRHLREHGAVTIRYVGRDDLVEAFSGWSLPDVGRGATVVEALRDLLGFCGCVSRSGDPS